MERIFPLRRNARPFRFLVFNFLVSGLAWVTAYLLVRPTVETLFQFNAIHHWSLLQVLGQKFLGPLGGFVLGFLLLDLSFYYWHRVNHTLPFLWRFHGVHHLDPQLDVSTSFRFHFGEIALSCGFRVLQILLIGPTYPVFVIYEICFQSSTLFHHSNLKLPLRLERALNLLVVTPRMHSLHHSDQKSLSNSNFSVVLRWWDNLHGSFQVFSQAPVNIGNYDLAPSENRLPNLLTLPFKKRQHD